MHEEQGPYFAGYTENPELTEARRLERLERLKQDWQMILLSRISDAIKRVPSWANGHMTEISVTLYLEKHSGVYLRLHHIERGGYSRPLALYDATFLDPAKRWKFAGDWAESAVDFALWCMMSEAGDTYPQMKEA